MTSPSPPDQALELAEYGEVEVTLTADQERILQNLARGRLIITPGGAPDRWRIKATSYVGTIVSPGVRLLIKPKMPIANLFYLLEASGKALNIRPEVFDYDQTRDLVPSFATFYARHLGTALSRGIPRDYLEHHERLSTIRGRISLPAQRQQAGLPLPAECRFDEYTADIPLNRILAGATARLLRLPRVTASTRRTLQQLAARLAEASQPTPADLRSATVFTRMNGHCRPAEHLARLVLGRSSLLDAAGTAGAAVFLIDMNKVFEQFVASRLRRYLARQLIVDTQLPSKLDADGHIRMRPDLVFRPKAGANCYVADTKYKITATGLGLETDYYQLLAYTSALNLPEGLLIYCQHDGNAPPHQITVLSTGTRLATWALRLDRTPSDLEAELQDLARHIAARATTPESTRAVGGHVRRSGV
jgi:5-methylcytosine-specific restriction enzyme subunit McrC